MAYPSNLQPKLWTLAVVLMISGKRKGLKRKFRPSQFVNFSFNYHQRNNVNSRGNENILIVLTAGEIIQAIVNCMKKRQPSH